MSNLDYDGPRIEKLEARIAALEGRAAELLAEDAYVQACALLGQCEGKLEQVLGERDAAMEALHDIHERVGRGRGPAKLVALRTCILSDLCSRAEARDTTMEGARECSMKVCRLERCCEQLADERDKAIAERDKAGDLLAVIHRDGGHHVAKVGWAKACQDAAEKWHWCEAERAARKVEREALTNLCELIDGEFPNLNLTKPAHKALAQPFPAKTAVEVPQDVRETSQPVGTVGCYPAASGSTPDVSASAKEEDTE